MSTILFCTYSSIKRRCKILIEYLHTYLKIFTYIFTLNPFDRTPYEVIILQINI